MRDRINNYVAVVIGRLCFLFYHLEIQNFWQVTVCFHYSLPLPLPQLCVKIYEDYKKKWLLLIYRAYKSKEVWKIELIFSRTYETEKNDLHFYINHLCKDHHLSCSAGYSNCTFKIVFTLTSKAETFCEKENKWIKFRISFQSTGSRFGWEIITLPLQILIFIKPSNE